MIRDYSADYLDSISKELIDLVSISSDEDNDKCSSVLKDIINFSNISYADKDDIVEIIKLYKK